MFRRLLAWLSIDWTRPLTGEPRGGGPALDRVLDDELHIEAAERGLTGRDRDWIEAWIRDDERARVLRQDNTAHRQPPRCLPGKAHQ